MLPDDLRRGIWDVSHEFFEKLEAAYANSGLLIPQIDTSSTLAADTPTVLCSLMAMARTGLDGVVDCYYASPRDTIRALGGHTSTLRMQALGSIQMPTVLLVALGRHLESIMPGVAQHLDQLGKGVV
jgi:hypothetical protein